MRPGAAAARKPRVAVLKEIMHPIDSSRSAVRWAMPQPTLSDRDMRDRNSPRNSDSQDGGTAAMLQASSLLAISAFLSPSFQLAALERLTCRMLMCALGKRQSASATWVAKHAQQLQAGEAAEQPFLLEDCFSASVKVLVY